MQRHHFQWLLSCLLLKWNDFLVPDCDQNDFLLRFRLNAPVVTKTLAKVFSNKLVSGNLPFRHHFPVYKGKWKTAAMLVSKETAASTVWQQMKRDTPNTGTKQIATDKNSSTNALMWFRLVSHILPITKTGAQV